MKIEKYDRRPFSVLAVQVNFENIHEVAEWCKGTITKHKTKMVGVEAEVPAIRVEGQGDSRGKSFLATLGCYVVELKGSFRVYKPAQFDTSFQPAAEQLMEKLREAEVKTQAETECLDDGSCCDDNSSVDGQETVQIA